MQSDYHKREASVCQENEVLVLNQLCKIVKYISGQNDYVI